MVTVGELVRDAIAKLRLKLLDLTNRNRLLNFKFADSSKKYVRVVDEVPGHLYERLNNEDAAGGKLFFACLPDPPDDQVDPNDTGVLVPKVAAAKGQLVSGLGRGTEDGSDSQHDSKTKPRLNLAQWARQNGV